MQKHYGPLVRLLHCAIDREIGEALEQVDLTASQGHIMGYLARQQGPPYRHVSDIHCGLKDEVGDRKSTRLNSSHP